MRIIRAVGHMTLRDWRFLLALIGIAAVLRVLAALRGFRRTVTLLPPGHSASHRPGEDELSRYRRMIGWAHRLAPLLNCLSISTAAWWLLRRRGVAASLEFGMAAEGRALRAHAWLEYAGRPISNEARLASRYVKFNRSIL